MPKAGRIFNTTKKRIQKEILSGMISQEGSIESLLNINRPSKTICNLCCLTAHDLRESVKKITDESIEPIRFLKDIYINESNEYLSKMKFQETEQELESLRNSIEKCKIFTQTIEIKKKKAEFKIFHRNRELFSENGEFYDENVFLTLKNSNIEDINN